MPSLAVVDGQFLLRGGQILLQPAALGGDVDGARGVQLDDDGAAREQPTSTDADGREVRRRARSATPATATARDLGVQVRARRCPTSRAGTFCRSASPWSLRNRRTSVTSFCMSAIRCAATASSAMPEGCGQSAITTDSPPGQRLPQRLGDERHHRVQQLEQRVEHGGQHRRGVRSRVLARAAPWPARGTSRRTRPRRSGRAPRRPG